MEEVRNTWERINGNDRDLVVERVLLVAGINHPQVLKTQVLNGSVHGAASAGCIRVLEFEPIAFGGDHHQKVQLGTGVGCPEASLKIRMSSNDFQGSLSEESEKVPKETWQVKSVGAE